MTSEAALDVQFCVLDGVHSGLSEALCDRRGPNVDLLPGYGKDHIGEGDGARCLVRARMAARLRCGGVDSFPLSRAQNTGV